MVLTLNRRSIVMAWVSTVIVLVRYLLEIMQKPITQICLDEPRNYILGKLSSLVHLKSGQPNK